MRVPIRRALAGWAVVAALTAVPVLALACFAADAVGALGQDLPGPAAGDAPVAARLLDRPQAPAVVAPRGQDEVTYLGSWNYTKKPSPGH